MANPINFVHVKDVEDLKNYVNNLEMVNIGWNGKIKYRNRGDDKCLSMNEIVQKLYDCYHDKYFVGSFVENNDLENYEITIKKLKDIENQAKTSLKSKNIIIRIAHWFASVFGTKVYKNKDCLFSALQTVKRKEVLDSIVGSHAKVVERSILNSNAVTLSNDVKDALDHLYENYYSKEFNDVSYRRKEAKWEINNEVIHRYNHGLAHSVRKAFFIPYVVEFFERNGTDNLSAQLKSLFEKEGREEVIAKLQIVMAFEVAGRDSECGSRDDLETYTRYLNQSKEAFKQYCLGANLVGEGKLFKDEEQLEFYSKAITDKYHNRFRGQEMNVVTAIVDATHTLDEFRCYWPSRMKSEIESINLYAKNKNNKDLWSLAKFCQQAVKMTGDRLMSEFADDEISDRNLKFKHGDAHALLHDNFYLTNSEKFVKCSKDAAHCWELLKNVPRPVFYSQGETTYQYVSQMRVENRLEDCASNEDKIEELSTILAETRAAIRLVNTKNNSLQFEMKMLSDPVFFRPLRAAPSDRDYVLSDRSQRTVVQRGYRQRVPLIEQREETDLEESEGTHWKPVSHAQDRGKPRLTRFTKKLSLSLLRKDGKIKHFTGRWPNEYYSYKPVGMLYDVNQLNRKHDKFVFDYDVNTSSKFWVGRNSDAKVDDKIGREKQLTLRDLQTKLETEVDENRGPESLAFTKMQHASNEMLMGLTTGALKAVFSPEDTSKERVRTFLQAVYLSQDYGIHVPVLVIDGKTEPRVYSKDCLQRDLTKLSRSRDSQNRKIYKELLLCFYSPTELKDRHISSRELFEKCVELMNPSIFPERSRLLTV